MASYNAPPDLLEQFEGILREYVERALQEYDEVIDASSLSAASKHTYKLHPGYFVRWLRGDYTPINYTRN